MPRLFGYYAFMPPKPILANDHQRRWVITGIMVLLLLASLSWAFVLSYRPTLAAAGLTMQLPGRWSAQGPARITQLFAQEQAFRSGGSAGNQLVVAMLQPGTATDLKQALQLAAVALIDRTSLEGGQAEGPLRLPAPGLSCVVFSTVGLDLGRHLVRDLELTVITDGTRYWAVLLTTMVPATSLQQMAQARQEVQMRSQGVLDALWQTVRPAQDASSAPTSAPV